MGEFREVFEDLLQDMGADVEVIRDLGGAAEARRKTRTLKNREEGPPRREYFGFSSGEDVRVGDVLQLLGTNDLWNVNDTETEVAMDESVQLQAFVEKRSARVEAMRQPRVPLELKSLHPEVIRIAGPYVADGHLRPAIVDTFIGLEKYVQRVSGSGAIGANLMQTVFSPAKPILRLSHHEEAQVGFMMLFAGAVKAIRNQYAHNLIDPKNADEALEWLAFASALFRLVDAAASSGS
jgi:uncharacterized protein (TIGR02391 family)